MLQQKKYVCLLIVTLFSFVMFGCSGNGTVAANGTGGTGGEAGNGSGGTTSNGGTDSECTCDDGFDCTIDRCVSGECVYTIGPDSDDTACPSGEYCTLEDGCVDAPACAEDADCEAFFDGDACKANIACEPASSVCTFDILDKDEDGDPPQVCGGGDCDDSEPDRYTLHEELCDNVDNDCDGDVDEGADADCSEIEHCSGGECVCNEENLCNDYCRDLQTASSDCGACGNACPSGAECVGGECQPCPEGTTFCHNTLELPSETLEFYVCVDLLTGRSPTSTSNNTRNCGECGNDCPDGLICSDGACECPEDLSKCGTECLDLLNDVEHCGSCGTVCSYGASCLSGVCTCPYGTTDCGTECMLTHEDEENCGECGNTCSIGATCNYGVCECPYQNEVCSGECIQVVTDPLNCGTCGNDCGEFPCVDGVCATTIVGDVCRGVPYDTSTEECIGEAQLVQLEPGSYGCDYLPPVPLSAEALDYLMVQMIYTPASDSAEQLPYVGAEEGCNTSLNGGWYYDDPDAPTIIHACPCTCAGFGAGLLTFSIGCSPVLP